MSIPVRELGYRSVAHCVVVLGGAGVYIEGQLHGQPTTTTTMRPATVSGDDYHYHANHRHQHFHHYCHQHHRHNHEPTKFE